MLGRLQIGARFILLVVISVIIVGVLCFALIYFQSKEMIINEVEKDTHQLMHYTKELTDNYLGNVEDKLRVLIQDPMLITALKTNDEELFEKISEDLTIITETSPNFENMGLFNKDCIVKTFDESGKMLIGRDFSQRDYCKGVKRTKDVYVSEAIISLITGYPIILIAVPIMDSEEELVGFFAGGINTMLLRESLIKLQLEGSKTFLLDRYGNVFIDTSEEIKELKKKHDKDECVEIVNKRFEAGEIVGFLDIVYSGERYFVAFEKFEYLRIVIDQRAEIAMALIDSITKIILVAVFVCVVLMILLVWLASRSITEPIKKLHKGIEIIKSGNLGYKVGTKTKDEIGKLSRSFDEMTQAIKKSRAEVDMKVEAQTKEIRISKEKLEEQQKAILNVLDDVKEEKQAADIERDKIDAILQSIGDGVFVIDNNFKIIMFNQVAADISGFSIKEVLGKRYDDVLKFVYVKDDKINDKFIKDAINTGEVATMSNHTIIITKDGKRIPVADSAAPLKGPGGKISGCVVVFRDVTREREIDQMKTDFISIASHQLRTPLTGIQWVVERILKMEKLPKTVSGYLNDVRLSAQRLSGFVTDLLNASRFEEGNIAIAPEKIELIKFIKSYIKETSPNLAKKKIKITFENHPAKLDILADRTLLRNTIQSLVSNAIEYTHEKGKIDISLEKKDTSFIFTVEDTGIGIPKIAHSTIFNKFTRADNAKTLKPSGSGLGLYLAKGAVDTVGGKIWFESEVGKGTAFHVELPIESKQKTGVKGFV